ncbi:MAG: ABC transporter permease [Bryobacteraceae bacterium]
MAVSPFETIRMALNSVYAHRFRALLTILGIVIGITTVVTVASLLTGLRNGMVTFFQELGPDNIFVNKTSSGPGAQRASGRAAEKEQRRKPILPEYAELLRLWSTSLDDVAVQLIIPSEVQGRPISARVPGFESDNVSLVGASANLIALSPRDLRAGRHYTAEEDLRGSHVAVIGSDLSDALFPDGQAIGRAMMVYGAEYIVIGVFAKAKGGFFGTNTQDTQISIPLHTARARYPQLDRYMLVAKARQGQRDQALLEVEALLRRIRRTPRGPNDFSLSTPDQIIQQFDRTTGLIAMVAIAISALGLLVGGIGVMNIMLVSVTERTREIGIRKALGARRRDISGQFLAEAIALTAAGGVLGIVLAVATTFVVGALVPTLPSDVPLWALAAALGVSVSVGLFFGVWPATKAAALDPVDALRYE